MSKGNSKLSGGGTQGPTTTSAKKERILTDDYGRKVVVVPDAASIPADREIWTSGGFEPNGEHIVVFARINGYNVDPSSLVGLSVSAAEYAAFTDIAGHWSWKSSKEADKYIKRYDKPGQPYHIKKWVARAIAFSNAMKKIGR